MASNPPCLLRVLRASVVFLSSVIPAGREKDSSCRSSLRTAAGRQQGDRMKRRVILQAGLAVAAVGLPRWATAASRPSVRVLCWSEGTAPTSVYPHDIAGAVADALRA